MYCGEEGTMKDFIAAMLVILILLLCVPFMLVGMVKLVTLIYIPYLMWIFT